MKDKTWAVLCVLTGLFGMYLVPFVGGVLFPLVIWLAGKDPDRPLLNSYGKETVNFQISLVLYFFLLTFASFVGAALIGIEASLPDITGMFFIFEVATILFLIFFDLLSGIKASVMASREIPHRYPLTIRFIK